MPDRCQILFMGSASIAIWKTMDVDLAPAHVIGRGFGGSTIADQTYYFDKIAAPYHPRAIFLYIGENDVSDGLEPPEIMGDLNRFLDVKTKVLGATRRSTSSPSSLHRPGLPIYQSRARQ